MLTGRWGEMGISTLRPFFGFTKSDPKTAQTIVIQP